MVMFKIQATGICVWGRRDHVRDPGNADSQVEKDTFGLLKGLGYVTVST